MRGPDCVTDRVCPGLFTHKQLPYLLIHTHVQPLGPHRPGSQGPGVVGGGRPSGPLSGGRGRGVSWDITFDGREGRGPGGRRAKAEGSVRKEKVRGSFPVQRPPFRIRHCGSGRRRRWGVVRVRGEGGAVVAGANRPAPLPSFLGSSAPFLGRGRWSWFGVRVPTL